MLKAIESNLYKVSINENYPSKCFDIGIKDTGGCISVYKEEIGELIEILQKSLELL